MIEIRKAYKAEIVQFQNSGDSYINANLGAFECDLFELKITSTGEIVKAQFCRTADKKPGTWAVGMKVVIISKIFTKNQHTLSVITPEEFYTAAPKDPNKVLPNNLAAIALKCSVEMHSYVQTLPYEDGAPQEIINSAHVFLDFLKENS